MVIDGDFDENKLSIEMAGDDIYGTTWTYFYITYDGKDFEDNGTTETHYENLYIIKPDGETEDVEIIDEVID